MQTFPLQRSLSLASTSIRVWTLRKIRRKVRRGNTVLVLFFFLFPPCFFFFFLGPTDAGEWLIVYV